MPGHTGGTAEGLHRSGGEWPCARFPYGDAEKQQYAELRASGSKDKLAVSLVTQQDGKKQFNTLLKSDGNRNWVTPDELKKLCNPAGELEAKVADLTGQLERLQSRIDTLLSEEGDGKDEP